MKLGWSVQDVHTTVIVSELELKQLGHQTMNSHTHKVKNTAEHIEFDYAQGLMHAMY